MTQTAHEALIAEIDAFLSKYGMAEWRFGELVVGDARFVGQMRDGARDPKMRTVEKIRNFIINYKVET